MTRKPMPKRFGRRRARRGSDRGARWGEKWLDAFNDKAITFGEVDDDAVIFNNREAWIFYEGKWHEGNVAVCYHEAYLLWSDEFIEQFHGLPPLPENAFKNHPQSRALRRWHFYKCRARFALRLPFSSPE
jgi:hypothetical protein